MLAGLGNLAQAAGNGSLAVSAVVPNCKFSPGAVTLAFGNLNPASTVDATATASRNFTCAGRAPMATLFISAGDGLHSTGPGARRMQNTGFPAEYMTYSLSLSPTSATVPKNVAQTLTVTVTIQPSEFQNMRAGVYQDTVVVTLVP